MDVGCPHLQDTYDCSRSLQKSSGFVDRARGTGRPTKKDRRELEEFTTPEFMDDFDFDFDFDSEE